MKIAFTGPSGSGKTTLVKHVQEKYSLPWINGSSGGLKNPLSNSVLAEAGLVVGKGHLQVIQSGHANPKVAIKNQRLILEERVKFFQLNPSFVTDRSTIDNWVYYATQCSLYEKEGVSKDFLNFCIEGLSELDYVFFIPCGIPIEDNGSRIPNYWYQHTISSVFRGAISLFREQAHKKTRIIEIHPLSLDARKSEIDSYLATIK